MTATRVQSSCLQPTTQALHVDKDFLHGGVKQLGAVPLTPHEAVVRGERVADALYAPLQLALELVAHGRHQTRAELFGTSFELRLGLTSLARQEPQANSSQDAGREQPGYVSRGAAKDARASCAQPNCACLEQRCLSDRITD